MLDASSSCEMAVKHFLNIIAIIAPKFEYICRFANIYDTIIYILDQFIYMVPQNADNNDKKSRTDSEEIFAARAIHTPL